MCQLRSTGGGGRERKTPLGPAAAGRSGVNFVSGSVSQTHNKIIWQKRERAEKDCDMYVERTPSASAGATLFTRDT